MQTRGYLIGHFIVGGFISLWMGGCPPPNVAPQADDQAVVVAFNTPKAITLTASDSDAGPQALTYSTVSQPRHGTLTGAPPSVTYAPNTGFSGSDSFTFKAYDGAADSNVASVSITVLGGGAIGGSRFTTYRGTYQLSWRDDFPGISRTCDVSGTLEFANPEEDTNFAPATRFTIDSANSSVTVANFRSEAANSVCVQQGPGFQQFIESGQLIIRSEPAEYALVLTLTFLTNGTCSPGGPYTSIGTRPQLGMPLDAACAGPKFVAMGADIGKLEGSASWTSCADSPPYESFTATLTWNLTGS
ncbi:MAG: Ig-like domain-containing protein [Phycisphaerae bacterium]